MTAISSILLPLVLAFELRGTRLPAIFVEALPICVLHELLELLGDIDFILESSSSKDLFVSLLLAFSAMLLLLLDFLILDKPNS